MDKIKIIHTTNGVINICTECEEEIMSINHKCNIFNKKK